MTVENSRAERIVREERAKDRADTLPVGEYHAYNNTVVDNGTYKPVMTVETHWDACLVMLAVANKRNGNV